MVAQKRLILSFIVLFAVVSVSLAGCVSLGTSQDPVLKAYIEQWHNDVSKNYTDNNETVTLKEWNVTWVNSTTAEVRLATSVTGLSEAPHISYRNVTITHFKTIDDATKFVDSKKMGYRFYNLSSHQINGTLYQRVFGHNPSVCYMYIKDKEGYSQSIWQDDTIVQCSEDRESFFDLSKYYDNSFSSGTPGYKFEIEKSFSKSTNERGNDVYIGVIRNETLPQTAAITVIVELTKSEAQAKQLFADSVTKKAIEGYSPRLDFVKNWKGYNEVWAGVNSQGNEFFAMYSYDNYTESWEFTIESG